MPEIAEHVRHAFQAAGYSVRLVEATSRYAPLVLGLPVSGEELEMDPLKDVKGGARTELGNGPGNSCSRRAGIVA